MSRDNFKPIDSEIYSLNKEKQLLQKHNIMLKAQYDSKINLLEEKNKKYK
jgi:hypothetical protein